MKQIGADPSIRVHVPKTGEVQGRVVTITHRTALFRHDAYLPEILQFAVERVPDPLNLSITSVACSNGAEVDSLLALYNDRVPQGTATVAGIDASPSAVEAARHGRYTLHRTSFFDTRGQTPEEKFLRRRGFTTSYEPNGHPVPRGGSIIADATPVRDGHAVRFVEHDAAEALPVTGEVDLAFGNNLLYHLDTEKATRVARNMGSVLSDRGVLSFGTNIYLADATQESVTASLREEFDLQPAVADMEDILVYARA